MTERASCSWTVGTSPCRRSRVGLPRAARSWSLRVEAC